jgi:uncharacterized membrane protein YbhN (UPF0104 family)
MLVRKIEPQNLKTAFESARQDYILLALVLVIPNVLSQFIKWRFVLRLTKPAVTNYEAFSSLLAGFALGFVTPGRIGEFGRALFISDCSKAEIVGLTIIDKLFSTLLVFLMGSLGLFVLLEKNARFGWSWLGLVLLAILTVLLAGLFPGHLQKILLRLKKIIPRPAQIDRLAASFNNFNRRQALNLLGFTALFYLIITSQFVILLEAFEPIALVPAYWVVFSIFIAKTMLPISLGDLGIRESAAVFFAGIIGARESTAFNASILIFLINLAIPSVAGFFLLLTPKMNQQLMQQRQNEQPHSS